MSATHALCCFSPRAGTEKTKAAADVGVAAVHYENGIFILS
jgi:hypothetical protein